MSESVRTSIRDSIRESIHESSAHALREAADAARVAPAPVPPAGGFSAAEAFAQTFADYPRHARGLPPMVLERGDYRLHFASTPAELDALLRLRFDVYNLELGEGLEESARTGRDVDAFDAQCHHLFVRHKESGECVGTYRLQTAAMAAAGCGFYADQEFRVGEIPEAIRAEAVEVGRACIGRAHRNGQVLQLLWKGLANYLLWNEKRYLFGACSLSSQDPAEGLALFRDLEAAGNLHPTIRVEPRAGWECRAPEAPSEAPTEATDEAATGASASVAAPEIPRLLLGYLNLGGSVCGEPALDRAFKTIDYLVLLDIEAMPPGVFRRFLA